MLTFAGGGLEKYCLFEGGINILIRNVFEYGVEFNGKVE